MSSIPYSFDDLDTWLAKRFVIKQGLPRSYSQTNEPYYTISLSIEVGVFDKAIARIFVENAMIASIMSYTHERTGTLYWRVRPEIESLSVSDDLDQWNGYARLLISDKDEVRGIINP